jgi:hypothetical protein
MGKGQRVQTQACSCGVGADKERAGFMPRDTCVFHHMSEVGSAAGRY